MLPSPIDLDQAAERREATVVAQLSTTPDPRFGPARRRVGAWFVAIGMRLAGEPAARLVPSPRA